MPSSADYASQIEQIEHQIAETETNLATLQRRREGLAYAAATGDASARKEISAIGGQRAELEEQREVLIGAKSEAERRRSAAYAAEQQEMRRRQAVNAVELVRIAHEKAESAEAALIEAARTFKEYESAVAAARATYLLDNDSMVNASGALALRPALEQCGLAVPGLLPGLTSSGRGLAEVARAHVRVPTALAHLAGQDV